MNHKQFHNQSSNVWAWAWKKYFLINKHVVLLFALSEELRAGSIFSRVRPFFIPSIRSSNTRSGFGTEEADPPENMRTKATAPAPEPSTTLTAIIIITFWLVHFKTLLTIRSRGVLGNFRGCVEYVIEYERVISIDKNKDEKNNNISFTYLPRWRRSV